MISLKDKMQERKVRKFIGEIKQRLEGNISTGLLPSTNFPDVTVDQLDQLHKLAPKDWVILDWVANQNNEQFVYAIAIGKNVSAAWQLFQNLLTEAGKQRAIKSLAEINLESFYRIMISFAEGSSRLRKELEAEYQVQLPALEYLGKVYA